jgi:hypothetical protein
MGASLRQVPTTRTNALIAGNSSLVMIVAYGEGAPTFPFFPSRAFYTAQKSS